MKNIAIFASGSGTNAEKLIQHFSTSNSGRVVLILTNRPDAFVLERARKLSVQSEIFDRDEFYSSNRILELLEKNHIDFIVLAGFLWLVPSTILESFKGRIVNIHPALLPKYGGKGMYGHHVHESVIKNGDTESGITIHYVNEQYDEGNIIFQAICEVAEDDTADTLAARIHILEHEHFPKVVEELINDL